MGNLIASFAGSPTASPPQIPFEATIGNQSIRASSTVAVSACLAVEQLVASHKVVIISKSWCPYSRMAKEALANYKITDMHVWEIDNESNSAEIQSCLKKMTGGSSVPRVFIDGKFVGGGEDTVRMHKSGELDKLLRCKKI